MITSNSLISRNAANKTFSAFTGPIASRTDITLNTKNSALLEITVNVTAIKNVSYLMVTRGGASTSDTFRPQLLDKFGNILPGNLFYFREFGIHTLYVDTLSFSSVLLILQPGAGAEQASVNISYALYAEKFSALMLLEERSKTDSAIQGWRISGNSYTGTIVPDNDKVKRNRYALFEVSVYSPEVSTASHFYVSLRNANNDLIYPELVDLATGEVVSYGNGQVRFDKSRMIYVDLFRYGAVSLTASRALNDENLQASLVYKGTTNELPVVDSDAEPVEQVEDIFIEGPDFKFVKVADFHDAWNGYIVSHDGRKVFFSNDLKNPKQQTFDLGSIVDSEGSEISKIHLVPYDTLKTKTNRATRINVVLANKKTYVNRFQGGGINVWGPAKFWEAKGTNRKIPVSSTSAVTSLHRFDPTLPAEKYLRNGTTVQEGVTFIEYQDKPDFTILGGLCRTKKAVFWGNYLTGGERVGIWATTDGGENQVLLYDFINNYVTLSHEINTSSFDAYAGGLSMKKVNMVYPTSENKEPATPFTYSDLAFSAIAKGATTTITAASHGLSTGDIVLFTGTPQDDNWGAITCDSFDGQGFKENVYVVQVVNGSTFRIKSYMGSYDTPLSARHVHSVNEVVGGAIASTGEEHPNGWFMYVSQKSKDLSTVVDAFRFDKSMVYRLNSSENGIQRACGLLMDNSIDPNIIFNSDTSNANLGVYEVEGRVTGLPPRSSNGIYKGKLSNIDDWSKFECVADIPEPAIWLYQQGNIIVGYYQLDGMAVSTDAGDTWHYFMNGRREFSGVFGERIAIANGYLFEWKDK